MSATQSAPDPLRPPALTAGATRLLDVASGLFYERGIHAIGVDTIAEESGITKRTLYDRFGSKDGLVVAYLQARHAHWWELLVQRVDHADRPRALAVFDAYVADELSSHRGCAFLNAAGELSVDHPAHRVVRAHKHAVRHLLAELLRAEASSDADRESVDTTADHLFLLLEGAIVQRGLTDDTTPVLRARAIAADLLT
ncbi:TetR/AcrR family transcriptional regulator [Aeromicrobium piscarium]|uniref:TetR/AcrR family transcriptional regulator n=1 Tax=Aeromicrobium piscarium TaxID=2590901 RepID=A0A554RVR5_9ACTN|nr:TetR/AcrR family transcriptional regulator [Aeromicrobium piscarium]TSD58182.1 TetR/AcrR family transcriptional regulator [Aeromicrobium piscarium]